MENNNNYPKYKDSGIEWIGEIPEHWDLKPLKHSVSINRDVLPEATVQDYELQYIDIGNVDINGLMNPPNKMLFKDSPSRARRITRNGDTIVSTVRTYLKAIAFIISDENNLISSTGFAVLTPNGLLHPKYIYYVVSSQKVIDTISSLSVGVSYPAITSSELGCIPIWFPREVSEQQAIADYLDKKAALIDELIEKKRRQIDLLTEQRQAVINQAVTKGLDPDVEMKDSGIEWLGEIPKHWEVKKGKYLFNIISGYAPEQIIFFDDADNRYFRVDDLNNDADSLFLSSSKATFVLSDIPLYSSNIVLFPKRGAAIFTNKVKITQEECLFDTNLMGLNVFCDIANIEYISFCLLSRRLDDIADTSTIPQINNKHIYY